MIWLRVKLTRDARGYLSAPLPTYDRAVVDEASGSIVVRVPDDLVPPSFHQLPTRQLANPTIGPCVCDASPGALAEWHAHLDARYREHAGIFRPEII